MRNSAAATQSTSNLLTDDSSSELLKHLSGEGFALGDDKNRVEFLATQEAFERNLNKALREKRIKEAVAIIHTEKPPTPLRDDKHPRAKILEDFLELGGRLVTVYKTKPTPEDGAERFGELCKSHANLINNHCPHSSNECSGATYLIKGKDNQIVFFSIEAAQAGARSIPMSLSLSPLVLAEHKVVTEKEAAQTQFDRIGGFLAGLGVNIFDELGRSSGLISGKEETTSGITAGASAAPLSTGRSSPLSRP